MSLFDQLVDQALRARADLSALRPVVEKELLHHGILREMSQAGLLVVAISRERFVVGKQQERFRLRLRDEHAVERIAMQGGQFGNGGRELTRNVTGSRIHPVGSIAASSSAGSSDSFPRAVFMLTSHMGAVTFFPDDESVLVRLRRRASGGGRHNDRLPSAPRDPRGRIGFLTNASMLTKLAI